MPAILDPSNQIESNQTGSKQIGASSNLEDAIGGQSSLDLILLDLRRLALRALDTGHPMAAAQIAATADRIQAALPERPDYPATTGLV